jgi:hypothetical protein
MARHDKTCANCADAFTTRWRKQLFCEECQIIRALDWGLKACNCDFCGTEFWPLKKTYTRCPACTERLRVSKSTVSPCPRCQKPIRTAAGTDKWCLGCVTATKKDRQAYLNHLVKRLDAKLKETV